MTLLVQKEVADRIVTKNVKESILSLSIKAFGVPKYVMTIPKGAFSPAPSVDSAILHISNISDNNFRSKNIQTSHFFSIVKAGFAHKRKFLKKNLETVLSKEQLDKIWTEHQLDPNIRSEDLGINHWFEIARNK